MGEKCEVEDKSLCHKSAQKFGLKQRISWQRNLKHSIRLRLRISFSLPFVSDFDVITEMQWLFFFMITHPEPFISTKHLLKA